MNSTCKSEDALPNQQSALMLFAEEVRAACHADFQAEPPSGAREYLITWRSRVHRPFQSNISLVTHHWLTPPAAKQMQKQRYKAQFASAMALTLAFCATLGIAMTYILFLIRPESFNKLLLLELTAAFPLIIVIAWGLCLKTQGWGIPPAWRERFSLFLIYEIQAKDEHAQPI